MKLTVLNNEFSLRPQTVKNYEASKQYNSRNSALKDSSVYPQDKIVVSSLVKHVIQSTDSREVELTYSIPLKKVFALIIDKDGTRTKIETVNLPRELMVIDSPELFSAFLKNTYTKVIVSSDNEPKIEIHRKALGGMRRAIQAQNQRDVGRLELARATQNYAVNAERNGQRHVSAGEILEDLGKVIVKIGEVVIAVGKFVKKHCDIF